MPDFSIENSFYAAGFRAVAGTDEAGRGPLCGCVTAAAVILPKDLYIEGLNDSKKLSEKKREKLFDEINNTAVAIGYGSCSEQTIDEINILNATKRAFAEAYRSMGAAADAALIDALEGLDIPCRRIPLIHGDALSYSIACASILAKVTRDRLMTEMDDKYPGYGFAQNKGYGTAAHIAAITELGPCPIHRRSFIKNFLPENERD